MNLKANMFLSVFEERFNIKSVEGGSFCTGIDFGFDCWDMEFGEGAPFFPGDELFFFHCLELELRI